MDKTELQAQMTDAMRARDANRLAALRQVMAAVQAAEKADGRQATEADVERAARRLAKMDGEEIAAIEGSPAGREARLADLREQAAAIASILPAQVEGDELATLVESGIAEVGATTRRDTGRVMAWLGERTGGRFDKAGAAKLIRDSLS